MMRRQNSGILLVALVLSLSVAMLPRNANAQTTRPKKITRVFWQDRETQKLSYADLVASDKWGLQRGWVTGFPALDAKHQQLSQMQQAGGMVMIAVRGDVDEKHNSGWMAINSGVFEEPHGNHFHWKYTNIPAVKQTLLDQTNGNPDRVYNYDNTFYVPNTTSGGFSQAVPGSLNTNNSTNAAKKFPGGNGRSALAVVNNAVSYVTHGDAEGDNAGRVDVVDLKKATDQLAYSFKLPNSPIHSTTVGAGKVFFATGGGICWTVADTSLLKSAETVQITAIAPSNNAVTQTDLQTRELVTEDNWVIYSSQVGNSATLCMINSTASSPTVTTLPIVVAEGLRLTNPRTVLSLGKRYAFIFQERIDAASDIKEQLTIIELDPNRDHSFADAVVRVTLPVGASKVSGDNGHHDVTFDAFGRYAVFTSPGDGVLTLMSLNDLRVRARFLVGGAPDNIIAVGAPEHFH
jgi:hypothetical protein